MKFSSGRPFRLPGTPRSLVETGRSDRSAYLDDRVHAAIAAFRCPGRTGGGARSGEDQGEGPVAESYLDLWAARGIEHRPRPRWMKPA